MGYESYYEFSKISTEQWRKWNSRSDDEKLMNKNVCIDMALFAYRDTPLVNGYSSAQLLLSRSLNSLGILTDSDINVEWLRSVSRAQQMWQAKLYNTR